MAMHACQIDPTDTTTPPCLGSPYWVCVGTRGTALRQATFLPPFLHCLQACVDGATTLLFFWILYLSVSGCQISLRQTSLYRLLLPLLGCGLLITNIGGGMVNSGVAMGRLYHSYNISILWCIVKATKATTWSHPSAFFSITVTKLSKVRDCSLISCRVFIASSRYS